MNTRTTFWQHLLKPLDTTKRSGPAAVLGVCVLIGAGAPVAWAANETTTESTSASASDEAYPDTALIIDASGSMWAADADGQVRMEAAKQATVDLVDQLPEDQKLALLTYGIGTGNSPAEKEAGCQDVHTLVKLGGAHEDIATQVKGLNASGYTPIGPALLAAEKELSGSGARQIVLVSDGIDTCSPPQVEDVAREIRERSNDEIVINVVGLNVNDEARDQLQKVAEVSGGVYADANDADSLRESLAAKTSGSDANKDGGKDADSTDSSDSETSTTETTSGSESTSGSAADGSGNGTSAALGGLDDDQPAPEVYQGSIPAVAEDGGQAEDQELTWKVDLEEGQQLNAGFMIPAPEKDNVAGGSNLTLIPTLTSEDGQTCVANATEARVQDEFSFAQSASLLSPVIESSGSCTPGEYTLALQRSGELVGDQELPVELSLWGVPQVDDADLAAASDNPEVEELTVGKASGELPTDTDMGAAPVVKEGTYDVELAPGETRWFKVPVEEGQRLQMQMEADPVGAEGHNVGWKVFSPLNNPVELNVGDKGNVGLNADEDTTADIATQPIRWANLKANGPRANGFLAGDQLVALRHTAPEGETTPAKFRLAVANTGEAETGPDFANATGIASGTGSRSGSDSATDSTRATSSNGSDSTSSNGSGTQNTSSSQGSNRSANVWWLLLLLFTLVGIVSYVAARKKWDKDEV